MLVIISLMLAGIALGFTVMPRDKSGKALKVTGKLQQIATAALLFFMGVWLGGNAEFWRDIKITGLYGLLFAVVTIIFSVLAVYFFSKLAFKTPKNRADGSSEGLR